MNSGRTYQRKKSPPASDAPAAPLSEKAVSRQIAWAAGTEYFQRRDPVYHVEESFCQTFDMMGAQRAGGARSAPAMQNEGPGLTDPAGRRYGEREGGSPEPVTGRASDEGESAFLNKTSMDGLYKSRRPESDNRLMNRFSELAFQRGTLSGAVLRGQGSMMLFSCLKRTLGQSGPKNLRERKLFQQSSAHKLMPGANQDMVVVNQDFTDSAIGLVTNVLRDSRNIVDSLTRLAEGAAGGDGAGTLQKMYPFLTSEKEGGLLEQYRARLARLGDGPESAEEKRVLQSAVVKTEALIHKKAQMKAEFISKLRSVSHSAAAAQAVFEQEEFRAAVRARLEEELPEPEPPPPDDGGDGKGANGGADDKRGEDAGDTEGER